MLMSYRNIHLYSADFGCSLGDLYFSSFFFNLYENKNTWVNSIRTAMITGDAKYSVSWEMLYWKIRNNEAPIDNELKTEIKIIKIICVVLILKNGGASGSLFIMYS